MIHCETIFLSLHAMATRFELVLHGTDPVRLRAAGEEALREIERLDAQLSVYRPESRISWINSRAAVGPVKVEPRLFRLLERCADVTAKTDGAFDITVAPLMRAWGFLGGTGKMPNAEVLESARSVVGMRHVRMNEEDFTIRFDRDGVQLDMGAVGKGYAIERATNLLREIGVTSALLHGGTSTISAIGTQPDGSPWRIGIGNRSSVISDQSSGIQHPTSNIQHLKDDALAVSAAHGKSFADGNTEFGHVIDPRTGQAVTNAQPAAVAGPSAMECDALSTALLVLGETGLPLIEERFPEYMVIVPGRNAQGD